MGETDRQREIEALLTPAAQLLLWLWSAGGEVLLAEARRVWGSKVHSHIYKLAMHGLVEETPERRGKRVRLTDKGRNVAECMSRCFA